MRYRLTLAAALTALALPALAQQITVVREVDSNNYDAHKTTARAASEVRFMLGDTLVSLDPDMQTIRDGLAESWTVSSDGPVYTSKLKPGIKFCSGREMTADDVVYSIKCWIDQATKSPVAWGKLATQEFDMFGMSYPNVSSGDALNLYFRSTNAPTPNRMNWKDPETGRLLEAGKTATDAVVRAASFGEVLEKVHEAALWITLYHEPMILAQSDKLKTVVPHNIYGSGLYKGLDLKFK